MRGLDLNELRRQFGRWQTGTWFEINDAFLGWQGKHRPFVLTVDYDGGPLASGRPRTSSSRSNFPHAAHEPRHESTCRINREGWITRVRASLDAEWLPPAYGCAEPDPDVVQRLRRES